MPIDIRPRAEWAEFAAPWWQAHAAAPPQPSSNPNWNPEGGVFIHHYGPAKLMGGFDTEDDCRRAVAEAFDEHMSDDDKYDGDIAYNFLVCQHGLIYQGRGYERGEANSPGYVGGIGRNGGFYSICALLRADQYAGTALLQTLRSLIQHLRTSAPRPAGQLILPHSYGADTDCPGNLLVYAQQGSTIDPSAPWTGPADMQVFAVQRWVNQIYAGVTGYLPCLENGQTGWDTVLSLTQALQHEHGISPVVQNFGPGTFNAVKARNLLPSQEFSSRLIRIYNGALWCKGYWASVNQSYWNGDSQTALQQVYQDAGLSYNDDAARRAVWPYVLKGLLRMDQFLLVPGGDPTLRSIQQQLNARYVAGVAIPAMSLVPCDGYYSRDVQQGLMMAIQYEIGIPPASVNGYFGPGTQAGLAGVGSAPLSGNLRYLFRAACYFNSPVVSAGTTGPLSYLAQDIGTDAQTGTHLAWLQAFQNFSQIPVTATNDYTTWAQLLVSTGNASRPASGCDCITEITASRASQLWAAGFRIVGRYLDEHLPPEDPYFLDKALKPGEPQTILSAGLRLFPIFQYNGTQLFNFTYPKGYDQAAIAHHKANEHRLPAGTCIYFAVDFDALDIDIDGGIKQYFQGVKAALTDLGSRFTFGVYGSRNVCSRISREVGARWSLVSGMSWGYSGNLGFALPENWALNQIRQSEFAPGWGLDHDVWRSGADPGVSTLDP